MAFVFRPAVARGGVILDLPRPVPTLRVQESWQSERFKVPLRDGDFVMGPSRNGVDITLQGQVASQGGALKLDEASMFAALEGLRTALHVGADGPKFQFILYEDEGTETFRHYRRCVTTRFEYDLSDEHLFTYSAVIHAEDAALYDAALE